jgi:hypothetical protein
VGLRDVELFDSPRLSTLKPFANQDVHFCSSRCIGEALMLNKVSIPCSNPRCSEHMDIGRALGMVGAFGSPEKGSDMNAMSQLVHTIRHHNSRDMYNLSRHIGIDALINDIRGQMQMVESLLDRITSRWHLLLSIGSQSTLRTFDTYSTPTQGPHPSILLGNEWPVDELAQTALAARGYRSNSISMSDKVNPTDDERRASRFSRFVSQLNRHCHDMSAPFATLQKFNSEKPGDTIYNLPFSTIGIDLPVFQSINSFPFLQAESDVGFRSAMSYVRHIDNVHQQLQTLMGLKFKGFCSSQCQRDFHLVDTDADNAPVVHINHKGKTRCLDSTCRKALDPQFAVLTMNCLEMVRVRVDKDKRTTESLTGYVCDELCAQRYMVERGAQLMRRARERGQNPPSSPSKI